MKAEEFFENWMKTWKAAGWILFHNETTLYDSVFPMFSSARVVSSTKVCEEFILHPLSFAYSIIKTAGYLPNLLLNPILEMSKLLSDLLQMWQSIIWDRDTWFLHAVRVVTETLDALDQIGDYIYFNTDLPTVAGEGVHQITLKVIGNIKQFYTSFAALRSMEEDVMLIRRVGSFPISLSITKIIKLLESNLEAKSRDYNDPALGYVFMINNLTYIGHELRSIGGITELDDDWFIQNTTNVEKNCRLYQSSSWNKMLDFLKLERDESMKERLTLFNLHFEKICNVQSTWIIYSEQLQKQIIKSIDEIMVLAYGKFIGRFLDVYGEDADDYILYEILDIQRCLSSLFVVHRMLSKEFKDLKVILKMTKVKYKLLQIERGF